MCGLSGIVGFNAPPLKSRIVEINGKIEHRGPDNESFLRRKNVAFGHRRLSIIDLDPQSNQPMSVASYHIVYNGEIYNFQHLKEQLIAENVEFSTLGDCEVVLKAYIHWGEECVDRFDGMWAFAIFDESRNRVFCSRDRFGIKPFYYSINESEFVFGSEIKQLLGSTNKVNLKTVSEFIAFGLVDHNEFTCFDGVLQLLPGNSLTLDLRTWEMTIARVFELDTQKRTGAVDAVEDTLKNAIESQLVSDVKVGTCLSGGLDSSYVNAVVSGKIPDLVAIHGVSSDKNSSELDKAEIVSEHLDIELVTVTPSFDDFLTEIEDLIYTQEHPFGDPSVYMQYCVMRSASHKGCRVMIDGQGADEVFMGYPKYLAVGLLEDTHNFRLLKFLKELFQTFKNGTISAKQLAIYLAGVRLARRRKAHFLSKLPLKTNIKLDLSAGNDKGLLTGNAFQKYELMVYPLQTLLRNEDRNSMRFSVEARVPYLSKDLVELVFGLPTRQKVSDGWTKLPLRECARALLPDSIVYRKDKLGFNSPASWLSKLDYSLVFESRILGQIVYMDELKACFDKLSNNDKWRFMNVALWERTFEVAAE